MDEPRNLTNKQEELLRSHGYRPVEVWVQDLDEDPKAGERWKKSARKAATSDEREGMNDVLTVLLDDLMEEDG